MLNFAVVPLVGTWIEMKIAQYMQLRHGVVPLVGTWIEIHSGRIKRLQKQRSFPSWERGLKSCRSLSKATAGSRSPRGNVD